MFSGDNDSGSGETSGDGASGSGDDSELAYVNDLWQFVSNATYSPRMVPGSGVTNHSSVLSVILTVVCYLFGCCSCNWRGVTVLLIQ